MQFLTFLLLMIGVTVLGGAGVYGFSYAVGRYFYLQEADWPAAKSKDCARFAAAAEWYYDLPGWKQALFAGWWCTNRILCALKGCR